MLNIQEIRELVSLIDQSSINEFTYETSGAKVTMKKQNGEVVTARPVAVSTPQQPVAKTEEPVVQTAVNTETAPEAPAAKDYDHEIVSPMVGTFYSSPSPDKEAFVQTGDKVKSDSVVCIVEAMKLFNEIEADVSGEIVEILVGNGELVEYGQPLFRVKTV
ncbi:acetyl-CoA carboxylase biotin carboxyl carrier protein [Radiobacillus sp. PE A8.2]|uniref:acetyl-CoA carboxylase biotin carboxyl carrier protein n=1 Tax=Radiobacillus sp. PE A8.2 TaxID=3380349 RepID=UPI00388E842F